MFKSSIICLDSYTLSSLVAQRYSTVVLFGDISDILFFQPSHDCFIAVLLSSLTVTSQIVSLELECLHLHTACLGPFKTVAIAAFFSAIVLAVCVHNVY